MPVQLVRDVDAARRLLPPAGAVVVVAVYNAYDDVVRCYESFLRHTPVDVPLLVVDDAGEDRRVVEVLERLVGDSTPRHVVVLQHADNQGFVRSMNESFEATGRSDVVLLNSDVVVGPEWFERLQAAALSSSTVATASTLTNHGTILSVPDRNVSRSAVPGDLTVDEAARRVASAAAQSRPRIPTAVAHCTYVRRSALDLVGGFDLAFSPGYSEEVDFCQRLVGAGMQHVCADDVFVYHRGGSTFGRSPEVLALQDRHERLIRRRYPYYHPWVADEAQDRHSPLAAAVLTARAALVGLRVGVDATCLGPSAMGTQVVVLETIRALARRDDVFELTVHVPPSCPRRVRDLLQESPRVRLVEHRGWSPPPEPLYDVLYRPFQVNFPHELAWLQAAGHRVVVNQLDLIAFHNGQYFSSHGAWQQYRQLAAQVTATVDGLAFISDDARRQAEAAGLLREEQVYEVVHCGVDHVDHEAAGTPPAGSTAEDSGYLLFLGATYGHKNRSFAIELLGVLRDRGWQGRLVLAGPTPPSGSTQAREAELLLERPELAAAVTELGAVDEATKAWLYRHAGLVLYPTVAEGFGLVPFEAASHGVPCLATRQGSLDEVLPQGIRVLDGWDAEAAADVAHLLLTQPDEAKALVEAINVRGEEFTWDGVADDVLRLFSRVVRRSSTAPGPQPTSRARRGFPRVHRAFATAVQQVAARPELKQRLSPPGSRREVASRAVIRTVGRQL